MRATTKQSGPTSIKHKLAYWGLVTFYLIVASLDVMVIWMNRVNEFTGWGPRGFQIIYSIPLIIIALLILRQRPHHSIAWLILIVVPLSVLNEAGTEYYGYSASLSAAQRLPLYKIGGWLGQWLWVPSVFVYLIYIPLTFPDGKLLSPRWRYALWLGIGASVATMLWSALYPDFISLGETTANPFGWEALRLNDVNPMAINLIPPLFAIPSVMSLLTRYRKGSKEIRQQMKWFVYVASFGLLAPILGNFEWVLADIFLYVFTMGLPLAIGISIMRYRLWDIDILINKSLVYAALSILLGLILAGGLFTATGFFSDGQGGRIIAIAVSIVIFGLIFQPARYQLQRFVDRRFYNIQIDYQKAPHIIQELKETISSPTSLEGYGNLELIGEGGMAKVYKAHSADGTQPVAIKVLPERLVSDADFSTRFRREAEVIAKLEHPNVVDVYSYGEDGKLHFMVMEYLNGPDIGEYLTQNGKMTLEEAQPIIENIAAALDFAHMQGLVHRDIKPSNIMLHYENEDRSQLPRAVLMDFGIAKLLDKTAITKTGGLLGTFDYIAPEQIQEAGNLDHHADIYSFGVLVFQMLTGRLPFEHSTPAAALIAHISQPPPHPRELEPDITLPAAEAILKALEKAPKDRFNSAGEFAAALS